MQDGTNVMKSQQILTNDIKNNKITNILLFLYGLSIGLPDMAVDVFTTRMRLDDGIMMILFLRFRRPVQATDLDEYEE